MQSPTAVDWRQQIVAPEAVLEKIEPGMKIFIGTGSGEPATLIDLLMDSGAHGLADLELIQLVSLGSAISPANLQSHTYRLKTFFSGWVASEAICAGHVDLIPSRFSSIPGLIDSGQISVDVAFFQVSAPNADGYCSFGISVDAVRQAMNRADLVVAEINPQLPMTLGDTLVPLADFDLLVEARKPPLTFPRWPVEKNFEAVAANIAELIEDRACIAFSIGPLFEALARQLSDRRDLGIHTPIFSDALMDLVKSGAVSNRYKKIHRGRSLTCYGFGTPELMRWLDHNPLVDFQSLDKVFLPQQIGLNPNFRAIFPARQVDLTGRIALHVGKGNVAAGPGEAADFINGAEISRGGLTIFGLPSRNRQGAANIRLSLEDDQNVIGLRESVDVVATEYGSANLRGRTVRERAQALVEIAHPEDRPELIEQAKKANILYPDQIFLADSAHLYPADIAVNQTFGKDFQVRFRPIRPSDEEQMRRLFYRFSDEAVYTRYFSPVKVMPHAKMQTYVNIDYRNTLSIVGLTGDPGQGHLIAEARYIRHRDRPWAEVAFVVDEEIQGRGIATYMFRYLLTIARQRGIHGFTADVLARNRAMMKVFERGGIPVHTTLDSGVYSVQMPFDETTVPIGQVACTP